MCSGGTEERIEPIHPGPPTRREQGGEGGPGSDRFDCDRSRIPGRVDGHLARGGFSGKPISTGAWHSGSAGMQVTVLTSQYERSLPLREAMDGVVVRRMPVAFRLSKGVVMPTIGWEATREVWSHDVVSLHLPQFDAAGVALRGGLLGRPTVVTYDSDV